MEIKNLRRGKPQEGNRLFVFPNVDGKFFRSTAVKYEIDYVLVDLNKGFFILNVKNKKDVHIKNLKEDILNHTVFIKHIVNYGYPEEQDIPIYGYICSWKSPFTEGKLSATGFVGSTITWKVFQPGDMKAFRYKIQECS